MPRRASSSLSPKWVIGGAAALVALVGGIWLVFSRVGDSYRTLSPLDVRAYLESSNSLRGNVYKLQGVVANQLAWSVKGRLYSVEPEFDPGAAPLPVLVPSEFNHVTIQKEQRFIFKVEVVDKGILEVKALQKL